MNLNFRVRIAPLFKLLRIIDAKGYFLMALFGFLMAQGYLFPLKNVFAFWAIILSFLAFGFSINECFDQREDKLDKARNNPIVSKEISFRRALVFSSAFALFGLFVSTFYGWRVFLLCLSGVLLTFFYSSPPLRFKSRPPFDVFFHGLFAGALIFLLAFFLFGIPLNLFYYLIAFSVFYFSAVLQLRNEFEDYDIDRTAGLKTSACVLGRSRTEKLLRRLAAFYPLFLSSIFLMFSVISPGLILIFFLITLVFFVLFFFFKNHKLVKNYKLLDGYNILACGLILMAVL